MKNRIVIIEDIEPIREGFVSALESTGKYLIINSYDRCESALAHLREDTPDVVLMDIELPGMSGIEGTAKIKKELPNCIILIITVIEDSEKVFQSLCAGAGGYIVKNANIQNIDQTIDEALHGGAPMSLSIAKMVVESFQRHPNSPLSERETEVLQGIASGKSYSKIAQELFIGKETVRTHIKNIYRKLEVSSKDEALRVANENKWMG